MAQHGSISFEPFVCSKYKGDPALTGVAADDPVFYLNMIC